MPKGKPRNSDFHTSVARPRYCAACKSNKLAPQGKFIVHMRGETFCPGSKRTPKDVAREPEGKTI